MIRRLEDGWYRDMRSPECRSGGGAGACHNNRYISTEFRGPGIEAERPPRNTEHSWSVQWTSAGARARRAVQAASSRAVQRYRAYSLTSFTFFFK